MYSPPMNAAALNFKTLPISERIQLVEDIWDSIAEETPSSLDLSDAECAELHRRFAAHQANPSSGVPWEQVRAGLFKGQH
jgi:putative addiction module component (TIGR02574 family)